MSGLTVGELRLAMLRLPDDAPVLVEVPHTTQLAAGAPNLMSVGMTDRLGKAWVLFVQPRDDP